jgi:hypothetical protein
MGLDVGRYCFQYLQAHHNRANMASLQQQEPKEMFVSEWRAVALSMFFSSTFIVMRDS